MSRSPSEKTLQTLPLRYLEAGTDGLPPVVLLHGLGAFKEIWWRTMRALAARFRGIALEWPGHGGSPAMERVATIEDLAGLVIEACAELGLERLALVGHSLGGRVAALCALENPGRIERLVLVDAPLDPSHIARIGHRLLEPRTIRRTVVVGRTLGKGLPFLRPAEHDHRGGIVRTFLRRARYHGMADPDALTRYGRSLCDESLSARLGQISQPTLVVTGAGDRLVPARHARFAAERIPNAELHVITGALHNPMDERPAELDLVLLEFLGRGIAGSRR